MHDLVNAIRKEATRFDSEWIAIATQILQAWAPSDARSRIAQHLQALPAESRDLVGSRSRETGTHYAWCLLDSPDDPVSIWINEYKDPRFWPPTYAKSVHNHRYDFATRILAGGYVHERYDVRWHPDGDQVQAVSLRQKDDVGVGMVMPVEAEAFHRIPTAERGTMTLLVKARPRYKHSISFDSTSNVSRTHVPIEARVTDLIALLAER